MDLGLMGYYTLLTSETHMDNQEDLTKNIERFGHSIDYFESTGWAAGSAFRNHIVIPRHSGAHCAIKESRMALMHFAVLFR
jgi:hypothetical protein